MRRGKDDVEWQELKKFVSKRDKKSCRFLKICTVKEVLVIQKLAPKFMLNCLDHAHIFPVSLYPEIMYDTDNVVLLNRYSHHNLDDCKHPVTGEYIEKKERDLYWKRIIGEQKYNSLLEKIKSIRKNEGELYGEEEVC